MPAKVPMTAEGYQNLRAELQRLKSEERPVVIRAIEEARAHGDLSENAEYHAAKERQRHVEGRIAAIEDKLNHADVIRPERLTGEGVTFGAHVTIRDGDGDETSYRIVGADEADVDEGLISLESPVAKALLGRRRGDTVKVAAPGGGREYTITAITYS